MGLLELVYEGGEVIDMALSAQRSLLAGELRKTGFHSADVRGTTQKARSKTLESLAATGLNNVLVRGLSGVQEAAKHFPRAVLFLDALGKSEIPEPRELAPVAFRTKRVFVYGERMADAVRAAGVGLVSLHAGPFFPRADLKDALPPEKGGFLVGVLSLGPGMLIVIGKLKKLREKEGLDFSIVAQSPAADQEVKSVMDVAVQSDLLVSPQEGEDRLGPDEGGILALCTGRALCAVHGDAFGNLPYESGKYVHATRYSPGSYANAALLYPEQRIALNAWPHGRDLPWDTVPREILRRL